MATWNEFEVASPALARLGRVLLIKKGRGYLATVRADGGPRVQAICPVLWQGRMYAGIIQATPKHQDLVRDGRYALHAPLAEGDAEFWTRGMARLLSDEETDAVMTSNPAWEMPVKNSLFDLDISAACGTIFQSGPGGVPVPDRRVFRAQDNQG
jgi:hypothetical protein